MDKKYYWDLVDVSNYCESILYLKEINVDEVSFTLTTELSEAKAFTTNEVNLFNSEGDFFEKSEIQPKFDPGAVGNRGKPGAEKVNNPSHYNENGLETIDAIKGTMSREAFHGFCTGNILKYVARFKFKNGIEDLKKARWYLDKMVEDEERGENNALK